MKLGLKPTPVIILLAIVMAIVMAIPALNFYYTGTLSGNGFSDDDVKNIEDSIRKKYEEDGEGKVQDVAMIINEPREMTGFVKIQTDSGRIIQADCNAQLGSNKRIIWQCEAPN